MKKNTADFIPVKIAIFRPSQPGIPKAIGKIVYLCATENQTVNGKSVEENPDG